MNTQYLKDERNFYHKQLTENIIPFWLKHALDKEYGGYHTCLNRDVSAFDYDKICGLVQGADYFDIFLSLQQLPASTRMAGHGWKALSETEKNVWREKAEKTYQRGYNLFVSNQLRAHQVINPSIKQ